MRRRSRRQTVSSAQLELGFAPAPRQVERVFLGWDQPLLARSVDYLFDSRQRSGYGGGPLDLRHLIVAMPVARAGARLIEALVARADAERRAVLPPRMITTGALADLLAPPRLPSPHATVRALLWGESLRGAPSSVRQAIVPNPPSPDDWMGWLRLGGIVDGLDAELASGLVAFDEVVDKARDLESFRGPERWRALARVRALYAARLEGLGLDDAHRRRRGAIEGHDVRLPPSTKQVVLVGAVDLNVMTRRMLDFVRGQVVALIHAPQELAARFDRFGCILPDEWQSGPIGELALTVVDRPENQAACVAQELEKLAHDHRLQDVVVGVPDPDVIPALGETLEQVAVPVRNAAGTPMSRTGPVLLLRAVAEQLQTDSYAALASLARHPDVTARIETDAEARDWRTLLDRYQAEHVAQTYGRELLGSADAAASLAMLKESLDSVLGELRGPPRPLARWAEPLALLLVAFYGQRALDPEDAEDRVVLSVCTAIRSALRALHELPEDVVGFVSASAALNIVLDAVAQDAVPDPPEREAVELLGWLELPFDDTPALVLTGFNEGFLPKSIVADPFLPDTLRRHLKLVDNRQRFGRDAFFLSAMLASRSRVALIAGRSSSASEPLGPSRLSLCADDETVARRVLAFYGKDGGGPPLVGRIRAGLDDGAFPIPEPVPLEQPLDGLSVTAFRDYLACPYRFYLKHVLKLRTERDDAREMDPMSFGNLAHDVLNEFGRSPLAVSQDWREIFAFLKERADVLEEARFGGGAYPAVRVQVEQLIGRFEKFAKWQARWAAQGKRILHAELPFHGDDAVLTVDDEPFRIFGRIDRVDRDESTGTLYVFDYKTSNRLTRPEPDHVKKGTWTNLQLPLYRLMIMMRYPSTPIELGYLCLSGETEGFDAAIANWGPEALRGAEQVIEKVIRDLRKGIFWPPVQPPPRYDDFAAICQNDRLGGGFIRPAAAGGGE